MSGNLRPFGRGWADAEGNPVDTREEYVPEPAHVGAGRPEGGEYDHVRWSPPRTRKADPREKDPT